MISGKCRSHKRAYREHAIVGNHAGCDAADGENCALRRIDNGGKAIDAEHAEIRHRKRSAFVVEREEFFLLRLLDKLATLDCQFIKTQSVGIADHRYHESLIERDGHTDVDIAILLYSLLCEAGIERRKIRQRTGAGV